MQAFKAYKKLENASFTFPKWLIATKLNIEKLYQLIEAE